tara:strand:- start:839 stop:961 length:123 start_codon:yes stop_codon:yes gene_type:complete
MTELSMKPETGAFYPRKHKESIGLARVGAWQVLGMKSSSG